MWEKKKNKQTPDSKLIFIPASDFQVQLTDFENAAYVVFVVLLTRVILSYKLDFLIPLSKVKRATHTFEPMEGEHLGPG